MLHAKTAVADSRWARVGSTNLNLTSWIGNWELDVAVQDEPFAAAMEQMYLEDVSHATEVVLTATPEFWFVMSMALLAGFVTAYPINWWLVARGLKHGMMTVRDPTAGHDAREPVSASSDEGHAGHAAVSRTEIVWMTVLSVAVFALAFAAQGKVEAVIESVSRALTAAPVETNPEPRDPRRGVLSARRSRLHPRPRAHRDRWPDVLR